MFDYISQGPPVNVQAPGTGSYALAADVTNGSLYVGNGAGLWKPVGGGLLANVSLTGQTSASNATTLYTVVASTVGLYNLNWYTKLTTTGTSPVLGPLVLTFKDGGDGTSQSVTAAAQTQAGANATSLTATTTAQNLSGNLTIYAGVGAITATLTVSGTIGAAVYEILYRLEYFG